MFQGNESLVSCFTGLSFLMWHAQETFKVIASPKEAAYNSFLYQQQPFVCVHTHMNTAVPQESPRVTKHHIYTPFQWLLYPSLCRAYARNAWYERKYTLGVRQTHTHTHMHGIRQISLTRVTYRGALKCLSINTDQNSQPKNSVGKLIQ